MLLRPVFHVFSYSIDEVFPINPSVNVFIFGEFSNHHKDELTFSDGTGGPSKLCYNFAISNDFTLKLNFPTWISGCDSQNPTLLGFFLSSDSSICSAVAFFH